jgi:hypothetical protein
MCGSRHWAVLGAFVHHFEPFKTEDEVEKAMDDEIEGFGSRGFIHKYTLQWDSSSMGMRGVKPP